MYAYADFSYIHNTLLRPSLTGETKNSLKLPTELQKTVKIELSGTISVALERSETEKEFWRFV